MPFQTDMTDGFNAEQTWRQLQWERHQRFLTQLKAEFHALRQQQSPSHCPTVSSPTPTIYTAKAQYRDRSSRPPLRNRPLSSARP